MVQTIDLLHCRTRSKTELAKSTKKNELPAEAFQAVVGGNGQLVAAAGAAALQNVAAIGGSHTFAEAVNTNTTSDFRLISTFGSHFYFFLSVS